MKSKRGQGLSKSTIVIIVVVVVCLVVILMIPFGGIGGHTVNVEKTETLPKCEDINEGSWMLERNCNLIKEIGYDVIPNSRVSDSNEDYAQGKVCCARE